jgi:antitoxin component of MazEF toxin-antitoxin module
VAAVGIPAALLEAVKLAPGSVVDIRKESGIIVIRPSGLRYLGSNVKVANTRRSNRSSFDHLSEAIPVRDLSPTR